MGLFWLICCIFVGVFASKRGRSGFGWGLIAVFISPLLAGVILAIIKDLSVEEEIHQVRMDQQQTRDRVAYNEKLTEHRLNRVENDINRLDNNQQRRGESLENQKTELLSAGEKPCPICDKAIKAEAIKCKYCGSMVNEAEIKQCPYCKENIGKYDKRCKHCDTELVSLVKDGM